MDKVLLKQKIKETVIDGSEEELFNKAIQCSLRVGKSETSPLPDYLNLVLTCEELSELQQALLSAHRDYENIAEEIADVRFCIHLVKEIFNIEYVIDETKLNSFSNVDQYLCLKLAILQQTLTKAIRGKDVSEKITRQVMEVESLLTVLCTEFKIDKEIIKKIMKIKCIRCLERSKRNII